jgi:hypothetical protein
MELSEKTIELAIDALNRISMTVPHWYSSDADIQKKLDKWQSDIFKQYVNGVTELEAYRTEHYPMEESEE